jgi:hypothetical protein
VALLLDFGAKSAISRQQCHICGTGKRNLATAEALPSVFAPLV